MTNPSKVKQAIDQAKAKKPSPVKKKPFNPQLKQWPLQGNDALLALKTQLENEHGVGKK